MIRYDLKTLRPYQAIVCVDSSQDFTLLYEPVTDPVLTRHLSYRRLLPPTASTLPNVPSPLHSSPALRSLYASLPFAPNLSKPDFIPTKSTLFLERLRDRLPQHRLLVADFSTLPDAVMGRNGPVVQTRYQGTMIPCETLLVRQGFFDIFFPTDFSLLRDTYSLIMNSPSRVSEAGGVGPTFFTHSVRGFRRRDVKVWEQADFLREFGGDEVIAKTRTGDGGSVMEEMYKNARVMF